MRLDPCSSAPVGWLFYGSVWKNCSVFLDISYICDTESDQGSGQKFQTAYFGGHIGDLACVDR